MPKRIASKEDWIVLGYMLFAQKGIAGIVIEQMAKRLKVNKSGFYWHFKTKEAFIEAIVTYWISTHTHQIITLSNSKETAKKKFDKLLHLIFIKDPFIDFNFYLKRYAQAHPHLQVLIDKIDTKRLIYVKNLLIQLDFSRKDATLKSRVLYKYLIGYHELIRYKKQSPNFLYEVKKEIALFIKY